MYRLIIITIVFLCHGVFSSYAQNGALIHQGEIRFEKKMNVHNILDNFYSSDEFPQLKEWAQEYKKNNPPIQSAYFTLLFNDSFSIYKPDNGYKAPSGKFLSLIASGNIIFTNLIESVATTEKVIMEEEYTVLERAKPIKWKITDEQKEIAGYTCRRANGLFMDSIYIVAFYTDEIAVPSGPESILGLPGMILGVALPHLYVSWFATNVEPKSVTIADPVSSEDKKISNVEFSQIIDKNPNIQGKGKNIQFIKIMSLL